MLDGAILASIGHDRVAEHYDMKVESMDSGAAVVSMAIGEKHLNGNETVQGGVTFALADVAFALAANSRGKAVGANASITYCAAAKSGTLFARAREISLSRKLGTYEVLVEDQNGKTIALFQALSYRKED
jgi:acyl-CoA thioesterase